MMLHFRIIIILQNMPDLAYIPQISSILEKNLLNGTCFPLKAHSAVSHLCPFFACEKIKWKFSEKLKIENYSLKSAKYIYMLSKEDIYIYIYIYILRCYCIPVIKYRCPSRFLISILGLVSSGVWKMQCLSRDANY